MRTKKAFYNSISSLLLQAVTLLCGFILPRAILGAFGSDANGVASSCAKFIGYISLLEAGVGGVTRAALYKPLSENKTDKISSIIKATENFFRKLALIFAVYVGVLSFTFPYVIKTSQTAMYVSSMVLVVSISTFVQYYFGMTYSILLQADQKLYISNILQIVTTLANTGLSLILINQGATLHIVKLGTSFVYILRPLVLYFYVKRKYRIDAKAQPDNDAIKDRWNGLGHHLAYFLHINTDIMLLTFFLDIKEVSVYSIYLMISSGIQGIVSTISTSLESGFGNILAKKEKELLDSTFRMYESLVSIVSVAMFSTAVYLAIPFVRIYTSLITDADYIRPLVAVLMLSAEFVYCIRGPYSIIVYAAGHYKQTQHQAFIEAGLNIGVSLALIKPLGMIGILIATLIAMLTRGIMLGIYSSKNILKRSYYVFAIRLAINVISMVMCCFVDSIVIKWSINGYGTFVLSGIVTVLVNTVLIFFMNYLFYRDDTKGVILKVKSLINK